MNQDPMNGPSYFPCRVTFRGAEIFVLWCSDDRDFFVRDEEERLLSARDQDSLEKLVSVRGIAFEDAEATDFEFDRIAAWCETPEPSSIDCSEFLNAWNFFDDLAGLHSGANSRYTRASREAAPCYDKLFWGNNLPSVTPPGEKYTPEWNDEELSEIRSVFQEGLALFEAEIN